jgi:hypothetical protein
VRLVRSRVSITSRQHISKQRASCLLRRVRSSKKSRIARRRVDASARHISLLLSQRANAWLLASCSSAPMALLGVSTTTTLVSRRVAWRPRTRRFCALNPLSHADKCFVRDDPAGASCKRVKAGSTSRRKATLTWIRGGPRRRTVAHKATSCLAKGEVVFEQVKK